MNYFKKVKKVKIRQSNLDYIFQTMRIYGEKGNEIFLYLFGKIVDDIGIIHDVFMPKQHCFISKYGVGVLIDSESIEQMNRYLFTNRLVNIVQVHSHPKEAYHSLSDNVNSIMINEGQYSIVIPYFGQQTESVLHGAKIFRLNRSGKWKRVFSANPFMFLDVVENE